MEYQEARYMIMKKIKLNNETVYIAGAVILSLATAMLTAADFGLSVIVSPAYLVSLKIPFLTFGQAEYVILGILFLVFCIVMRRGRFRFVFEPFILS